MNFNCSNVWYLINLQEQVKKSFCYQKLFWPFTVWINCSSDLKNFANSRPSASNFKSFSQSLEQFFLTVGQNNFGNKIPLSLFALLYKQSWKNIRPLMPTKDFEGLKKSTRSMKSTQVYEFQTYILSSYWIVIYFLCIHNSVFRGHTANKHHIVLGNVH